MATTPLPDLDRSSPTPGLDFIREALGIDQPAPEWEARATSRALVHQAKRLSYREIARRLNAEKIPTARGGRWHSRTVTVLLLRYAASPEIRRTVDAARREHLAHRDALVALIEASIAKSQAQAAEQEGAAA